MQWAVYKVSDEVSQMLGNGLMINPPQIVLESLVMNGMAKRVAITGSLEFESMDADEEGPTDTQESEEPAEGDGPWYNKE
jgi:hypothetical protein